jgi:hypothetical protein
MPLGKGSEAFFGPMDKDNGIFRNLAFQALRGLIQKL